VNSARRRNRSLWEVLEELERQPGILRVSPETRATVGKLVADMRQYSELAHERPAGEVLYAFLRGSGLLARLAASDSVGAAEALQNIARFFDIVRGQSALLADDRAVFNARVDARTAARPGAPLRLAVDPSAFHFFDPQTGANLALGSQQIELVA
jgi:hypothetical protein